MSPPSADAKAEGAAAPTTDEQEPKGDEAPEESQLLRPGNRLRIARGGITLLVGAAVAVWLMAFDRHVRGGVPLGTLAVLVATWGALDLAGTFDDAEERVQTRVRLADLAFPLFAAIGSGVVAFLLLSLAVEGRLSLAASAVTIPAAAVATVASVFHLGAKLGPWRLDENGEPRGLLRRHGFWVVVIGILLYLPMMGSHSLTDPWETHYGEVAREMLARDDWISTWWAQEGWFFSKPVLDFWIQALAMASLGVRYEPDQMLATTQWGTTPRPEWAVRLPIVLFAIVAAYLLYKGAAKVFGRRAAFLGALVLLTMPMWSLLAHQTMTDMPFVASLTAAMGLFLWGLHTDPELEAKAYELEVLGARFRLTAYHLVFGAILVAALPQAFYLISRNVEWVSDKHGFHWHADVFSSGSKGNCGLPGNEACVLHRATIAWFQPAYEGLLWLAVVGLLVYVNWGERRLQRLAFQGAFFFAAVSTLGKGPAGILLPVACAVIYVVVTGKWRELAQMELMSGLLIVLAVALPWYVAMYVRHGPAFVDRLIFHDMWKRALTHVHDTNEGDDVSFRYYVWQLGYATFPWTGLVPLGLVWWARKPDDADRGKGDASVFLAMWFVFAFALFTAMLTKFHHYIFPAVPPAAMLVGVVLDRMLGGRLLPGEQRSIGAWVPVVLAALASSILALGFFRFFPGQLDGFRGDEGQLRSASPTIGAVYVAAGLALAWWAWRSLRDVDAPPPSDPVRASFEDPLLSAAAICGAVVVALVGRDLASRPEGDIVGASRLLFLFTYNYKRAWPDTLDFAAALAGVTIASTAVVLVFVVPSLRRVAIPMICGVALAFAAWCLDVYFFETAPHWGQRNVIEAYYRTRSGPAEPLVAFQMNWKGENFYTGNHVAAFVSTGEKLKEWVKDEKERGVHTFFFVLEHGRVNALRAELGNPTRVDHITDRRTNNKFTLVRVTLD